MIIGECHDESLYPAAAAAAAVDEAGSKVKLAVTPIM